MVPDAERERYRHEWPAELEAAQADGDTGVVFATGLVSAAARLYGRGVWLRLYSNVDLEWVLLSVLYAVSVASFITWPLGIITPMAVMTFGICATSIVATNVVACAVTGQSRIGKEWLSAGLAGAASALYLGYGRVVALIAAIGLAGFMSIVLKLRTWFQVQEWDALFAQLMIVAIPARAAWEADEQLFLNIASASGVAFGFIPMVACPIIAATLLRRRWPVQRATIVGFALGAGLYWASRAAIEGYPPQRTLLTAAGMAALYAFLGHRSLPFVSRGKRRSDVRAEGHDPGDAPLPATTT